jgi:hypothetical protein
MLFLFPVIVSIMAKIKLQSKRDVIAQGTFCFRPSHKLCFGISNMIAIGGIGLELVQHLFYCFPPAFISGASEEGRYFFPAVQQGVRVSLRGHCGDPGATDWGRQGKCPGANANALFFITSLIGEYLSSSFPGQPGILRRAASRNADDLNAAAPRRHFSDFTFTWQKGGPRRCCPRRTGLLVGA